MGKVKRHTLGASLNIRHNLSSSKEQKHLQLKLLTNYIPRSSSFFFFSSRRRHTRYIGDWSSDVCSSDLIALLIGYTSNLVVLYKLGVVGNHYLEGIFYSLTVFAVFGVLVSVPAAILPEIGRASCRERVYISVLAVVVKERS